MSQIAQFINSDTAMRTCHHVVAIYESDSCNCDDQWILAQSRGVSVGHDIAWQLRNTNQSFRRCNLSSPIYCKENGPNPPILVLIKGAPSQWGIEFVMAAVREPQKKYPKHQKHIAVRAVIGHAKGIITSRKSLDQFSCESDFHLSSSAWPLSEWSKP